MLFEEALRTIRTGTYGETKMCRRYWYNDAYITYGIHTDDRPVVQQVSFHPNKKLARTDRYSPTSEDLTADDWQEWTEPTVNIGAKRNTPAVGDAPAADEDDDDEDDDPEDTES